jgi:hypothetical protein
VTADPAGIVGDARGEVRRFCLVRHDEVTRLDELARKLRSLNGEGSPRIERPKLLSALLLSGLALAEAKAQTLVVFPGIGVRFEYPLKLKDAGGVRRFSKSHWPSPSGRPTLGYIHGALIRLALQAAETDDSFLTSDLAPRLAPRPSRS